MYNEAKDKRVSKRGLCGRPFCTARSIYTSFRVITRKNKPVYQYHHRCKEHRFT